MSLKGARRRAFFIALCNIDRVFAFGLLQGAALFHIAHGRRSAFDKSVAVPRAARLMPRTTRQKELIMRIFVAGAAGAVGRPLVSALVAAGHSVVGLTRTAMKTDAIRRMGAEPIIADGLDEAAVRHSVMSTRPDVIIDEMTDLAAVTDLRHFDRAFANTNRLRTRGTDLLLAAAREAGVRRFIAQSFCGWVFARSGDSVKTETD